MKRKTFLKWAIPIVAIFVIILMLVPPDIWNHPKIDAIYEGFDPNLIYASSNGNSESNGIIEVNPNR